MPAGTKKQGVHCLACQGPCSPADCPPGSYARHQACSEGSQPPPPPAPAPCNGLSSQTEPSQPTTHTACLSHSVTVTDDLGAGKDTKHHNPVPGTRGKPSNIQYTQTTSNLWSHQQSHPSTVPSTHMPQSTHPQAASRPTDAASHGARPDICTATASGLSRSQVPDLVVHGIVQLPTQTLGHTDSLNSPAHLLHACTPA